MHELIRERDKDTVRDTMKSMNIVRRIIFSSTDPHIVFFLFYPKKEEEKRKKITIHYLLVNHTRQTSAPAQC